jgi:hypothetical protein
VAKDHGHIVAEPCRECGKMIPTGRMMPFGMEHAESCSHHSTKVPEGRFSSKTDSVSTGDLGTSSTVSSSPDLLPTA